MCIAAIAWRRANEYPLIVVANRDERHARPTAPLARWDDGSGIVAGRDLQSGGTWLGIGERTGRLALITNFRDPDRFDTNAPSRGALVTQWLSGDWSRLEDKLDDLARYNGFSLILIDGQDGWILDNRTMESPVAMQTGRTYGLSNGPLARPWPKVERLLGDIDHVFDGNHPGEDALFASLARTGANVAADRADAPAFIVDPVYGTRCSTVVVIDAGGRGTIAERRFDRTGAQIGRTRIDISLDWPPSLER